MSSFVALIFSRFVRFDKMIRQRIPTPVQNRACSRRARASVKWSGPEFEEFLRHGSEFLLKRFFGGEAFPDAPADLKNLAESTKPVTDEEVLALYASV